MLLRFLTIALRLSPVLLLACQSGPAATSVADAPLVPAPRAPAVAKLASAARPPVPPGAAETGVAAPDSADPDYAIYFVVVADTSRSYFALRSQMLGLSQQLTLPIDTLGRYFNARKNRIIMPETDEDEMYAGEYYPRRFPSHSLSLEYLSEYQNQAGQNTMALVTGIYEKEASADSALAVLRNSAGKTFKVRATIYTGCMH